MRILFIGNSYTYCNDLPGMVRALSAAAGRAVETATAASGGKTLAWHAANPATLDALGAAPWDVVVLQEQSLRPIEAPEKMIGAARDLAARILAVPAAPVLYVTWARQRRPETQDAINDAYRRAARETGARLAPVGPAWRRALEADPALPLFAADGSHPSPLGSGLAACVFHATLFGAPAADLPGACAADATPDRVALLRRAARDAVREFGAGDVQRRAVRVRPRV